MLDGTECCTKRMSLLRFSLYLYQRAAVVTVLSILALVPPANSQCPVSVVSSDDLCAVVSQGSLSYTCINDATALKWSSPALGFNNDINVVAGIVIPPVVKNGVTFTETNVGNATCISSTLTITGSLAALSPLNGMLLLCCHQSTISGGDIIVVPAAPDPPVNATCDTSTGNQVTLQWTPPTNTGGSGVIIDHYLVTVSGPAGYTCPTDQCNVTTNSTTLTGLECGSSYNVSVRAVNCRNTSDASNAIMINLSPPGKPIVLPACIAGDGSLTLNWTADVDLQSVCGSSLSYNLTVFDDNSTLVAMSITTDTSALVPVGDSDNYTVTISAINGCGAGPDTSIVITSCVTPSSTIPVHSSSSTTIIPVVSNACVDSTTSCQLQVGVGIPVTFLLTAIISSLITLLITCLIMRRRESHDKFTPSVVQEPVHDPVSVSVTRPGDAVEMKSNVC